MADNGKPKRVVNVDELRELGVPEVLIQSVVEMQRLGLLDIEPPLDLHKKIMEHTNKHIVRCVERCTGKVLGSKRAWVHFSECQRCKDAWRQR